MLERSLVSHRFLHFLWPNHDAAHPELMASFHESLNRANSHLIFTTVAISTDQLVRLYSAVDVCHNFFVDSRNSSWPFLFQEEIEHFFSFSSYYHVRVVVDLLGFSQFHQEWPSTAYNFSSCSHLAFDCSGQLSSCHRHLVAPSSEVSNSWSPSSATNLCLVICSRLVRKCY